MRTLAHHNTTILLVSFVPGKALVNFYPFILFVSVCVCVFVYANLEYRLAGNFVGTNFRINGLIAVRINFRSSNFRILEEPDYAHVAQNKQ